MSGTRFRIPRKVKKARAALHGSRALTAKQRRWLGRCLVMRPQGWRGVRRRNAHVAMGDTSALRRREVRERARLAYERQDDRRAYGRR